MSEETAGYILKKNKNSSCYSLQLKGPNKEQNYVIMVQLVTTIINQIPNSFYDETTQEILFTAESVTNITNFNKTNKTNQILLNETQTMHMIKCLTRQIEYLNKNNLAFYGFEKTDIIVINENIFLIASLNYLYTLDKERNLNFYTPISKPFFSSPEFMSLRQLPSKISYKTNYHIVYKPSKIISRILQSHHFHSFFSFCFFFRCKFRSKKEKRNNENNHKEKRKILSKL